MAHVDALGLADGVEVDAVHKTLWRVPGRGI